MEKRYANIAGMQQKLYFARDDDADPEVQVIYTPGLDAPGYPDDRVIAVDLDHNVTRVLNSDYFGESKKRPADVEQPRVRARRPRAPAA